MGDALEDGGRGGGVALGRGEQKGGGWVVNWRGGVTPRYKEFASLMLFLVTPPRPAP